MKVTDLINGFSELSDEEKLKALSELDIDDGKAEIEKLKTAVTKANGEAAEWKRKHNSLLSEEEQKKQALEEEHRKALEELETLKKEKVVASYKASYMGMGYDEKLAEDTAVAMANGNTEKVFQNQKAFLESFEKGVRSDLIKGTPKPETGSTGTKTLTKEEFDKMEYSERAKLFEENPELYKTLTKK